MTLKKDYPEIFELSKRNDILRFEGSEDWSEHVRTIRGTGYTFSMEDYDFLPFCGSIFRKYLKEENQRFRYDEGEDLTFNVYDENWYTIDDAKSIVNELENLRDMFRRDFDAAFILTGKEIRAHDVVEEVQHALSPEEEKQIIRDNVDIIINFYDRFIRCMKKVINEAESKGLPYFVVSGP